MKINDQVTFFDENKKQFTGIVTALRNPIVNENGKVIRKNLIDIKVSRMPGVFQAYLNVPLKNDLEEGEKTFYYELSKKRKNSTSNVSSVTETVITGTADKFKSIFTKNSQ